MLIVFKRIVYTSLVNCARDIFRELKGIQSVLSILGVVRSLGKDNGREKGQVLGLLIAKTPDPPSGSLVPSLVSATVRQTVSLVMIPVHSIMYNRYYLCGG